MKASSLRLSYLTLSDDEGEGEDDVQKKDAIKGLPCSNSRCDQEPICVNGREHYCSRECYQKQVDENKKRRQRRLREDDMLRFKHVTIIGRGGTGLLNDREQLDFIQVWVRGERVGRTVRVDNASSECCKWKSTPASTKTIDKAELKVQRKQEKEDKQKLKGLFACYSDSSASEDEGSDDKEGEDDEEGAQEEIHQRIFCRGINSSICPVHLPLYSTVGKPLKGYVINIASPWELYIQTAEMIQKAQEIDAVCNREQGIDARLVVENWRPEIGGFCCAKYEGQLYRAKILEHVKDSFRVKYVDYGNIALVPVEAVSQLNPEVTMIPRQCIYYKVSNAKPMKGRNMWSSDVRKFAIEHLDGGCVEMEVEVVEWGIVHVGKLNVMSSLSGEVIGDFGDNLVSRKLAESE